MTETHYGFDKSYECKIAIFEKHGHESGAKPISIEYTVPI